MNKINYNYILKLFIIFIILYGLLNIIPVSTINNNDLFLIISIGIHAFYLLNI